MRWHTSPRDIAALVTEAKPDRFTARVYCFGETERTFEAELLLLRPGKYRVTIDAAAPQSITIAADARCVALKLPSRKEAIVRIEPAP